MTEKIDWSKFEETKVGDKAKTKIKEVNEGKEGDFRSEEYWTGEWASDMSPNELEEYKKHEVIEVVCENGAKDVYTMPKTKQISPRSNLALFKRTYGSYPEVGLEVVTKVSDKGFNNIVLEK